MDFKVINWNIGGAKFLETKRKKARDQVRRELNYELRKLVQKHDPDVITLQEIVRYKEPKDKKVRELLGHISGYIYYPFILIDSHLLSSESKWNKVKSHSDWHKNTYFAQGNGFYLKKSAPCFRVWDLWNLNRPSPDNEIKHYIEHVHLDSGLYFGDRNTEPRAALVVHLIYDPGIELHKKKINRKPLDIFVVNLHLVTLMMERQGIPEIDTMASKMRMAQLDIVFNGIISRYNRWAESKYPERGEPRKPKRGETFERHAPVWILAGDFNFTETSTEFGYIKKMNFIDTIKIKESNKGYGTKSRGAGKPPTLTLDYIFAGPKFIAFDPLFEIAGIQKNSVDHDVKVSDHYPLFATIPILIPKR